MNIRKQEDHNIVFQDFFIAKFAWQNGFWLLPTAEYKILCEVSMQQTAMLSLPGTVQFFIWKAAFHIW